MLPLLVTICITSQSSSAVDMFFEAFTASITLRLKGVMSHGHVNIPAPYPSNQDSAIGCRIKYSNSTFPGKISQRALLLVKYFACYLRMGARTARMMLLWYAGRQLKSFLASPPLQLSSLVSIQPGR